MDSQDIATSLKGKVALVTGATSGLGLRIFRALAARGARVYVSGRNEEVGRRVAAEFPDTAVFVKVDISTVRGAKEGAEALLALEGEHGRLNILVNNAAPSDKAYALSPDGIVDGIGTTFIGHFVLVQFLLPLLKKTASLPGSDVRIVTVSSGTYKLADRETFIGVSRGDFSNKYGDDSFFNQVKRNTLAKTAQVVWMRELAARLKAEDTPIKTICADPGGVYSEGARAGIKKHFGFLTARIIDQLFYWFAASPEVGAVSTLWAATSPDAQTDMWVERSGSRSVVAKWTDLADDEDIRKDLWRSAQEFVDAKLKELESSEQPQAQ